MNASQSEGCRVRARGRSRVGIVFLKKAFMVLHSLGFFMNLTYIGEYLMAKGIPASISETFDICSSQFLEGFAVREVVIIFIVYQGMMKCRMAARFMGDFSHKHKACTIAAFWASRGKSHTKFRARQAEQETLGSLPSN